MNPTAGNAVILKIDTGWTSNMHLVRGRHVTVSGINKFGVFGEYYRELILKAFPELY